MKKLALILMAALIAGPASAQIKLKSPGQIVKDIENANERAKSTVTAGPSEREKLGCDFLNLKPGCKAAQATDDITNLNESMSDPLKAFVTFVQGDLQGAISLSSSIPSLPDGNGQACYTQLQSSSDIIKQLEGQAKSGQFGLVTAFEALRLLHMNMVKTCNNKACTQIFNEASNVVAAAAPMKTMIPNVSQICSQIPSIAMEPVTTASASPTPSPTPSSTITPAATPSPTPSPTSTP